MDRACLDGAQDGSRAGCLVLVVEPCRVSVNRRRSLAPCIPIPWPQLEEARSTISRLEREMGGLYRDKSNLLEVGEGRRKEESEGIW